MNAQRRVEAVVIGASAGGVDALFQLFGGLPADFRLPMVAVLHLPENHESQLVDLFARRLLIPVQEARDKAPLEAGTLYFAAAGYHLSIERDRSFALSREAPRNFSRPSIDILFDTAADAYRDELAGILLTGANQDGAEGLAHIHREGGLSIVQDPAEAAVSTMPEAAIALHAPDHILPLREIHALLARLGSHLDSNNAK
ncbi:chemotaxis protein CheB [Pseudomonas sp. CAN2814]|jgi:two-component system chemotaxis response regulator CheB|uniref:chemotaxis protein CheB n=1 Tax=Pseudomonas sp. CAN1 TaxID=3046726 RepID=UPI002647AE1E|nr:chemotaxis protein CheB [Pseudomonas sp. CAN1]MDN6860474.1 chemotaxis protein CheB [Pseudomonas sp. CAN1]